MRKVLLTILAIMIAQGVKCQSVVISDAGMKQCLLDNYPSVLNPDSTLNQAAANNYAGQLECPNYSINEISIISEFPKIWRLQLHGINVADLSPILDLDSVRQFDFDDGNASMLPDLSSITTLRILSARNAQITSFPQLNDSIEFIDLTNNSLSSVSFNNKLLNLVNLTVTNNQISIISNIDSIPKVKNLFLAENNLTSIPSLQNLDSLALLHIYRNSISSINGLDNKTKLKVLDIRDNEFSITPSLVNSFLTTYRIQGNRFTFEDIEPLFALDSFPENAGFYYMQQPQGNSQTYNLVEGQYLSWNLDFDHSITNNYYLWYKDSVLIDSTIDNFFEISTIQLDDAGSYHCVVKNTGINPMALVVNPITLNITPFDDKAPIAFSPNGDGDRDFIYIETTGTAKIYNEAGTQVRELTTPYSWYGDDNSGNKLPFGYYLISINDSELLKVTLVR